MSSACSSTGYTCWLNVSSRHDTPMAMVTGPAQSLKGEPETATSATFSSTICFCEMSCVIQSIAACEGEPTPKRLSGWQPSPGFFSVELHTILPVTGSFTASIAW